MDRFPYDGTTYWLRIDTGDFIKLESFDTRAEAYEALADWNRQGSPQKSVHLTRVVEEVLHSEGPKERTS